MRNKSKWLWNQPTKNPSDTGCVSSFCHLALSAQTDSTVRIFHTLQKIGASKVTQNGEHKFPSAKSIESNPSTKKTAGPLWSFTSWWFQPHLKNISRIGLFPQVKNENSKNIWVATTQLIVGRWKTNNKQRKRRGTSPSSMFAPVERHSDVGPKGLAPPGPLAGVWWRAFGFSGASDGEKPNSFRPKKKKLEKRETMKNWHLSSHWV